ncbi:MAG: cobamide remodeling phosphodiesterase CbiR, partial [Spirochaetota bacterium]|nr:cobamide remodeling phosphodiesterase CbiR [Spirochaetota bacterium]
ENLNYPFEFLEDIIAEYDLSICIDIGHLIIGGNDVEEHLNRYIDSTRVIHLHGVDKERDHVSIRHIDKRLLMGISEILKEKKYGGVLTMEIFSEADFEESLTIVQQYFI